MPPSFLLTFACHEWYNVANERAKREDDSMSELDVTDFEWRQAIKSECASLPLDDCLVVTDGMVGLWYDKVAEDWHVAYDVCIDDDVLTYRRKNAVSTNDAKTAYLFYDERCGFGYIRNKYRGNEFVKFVERVECHVGDGELVAVPRGDGYRVTARMGNDLAFWLEDGNQEDVVNQKIDFDKLTVRADVKPEPGSLLDAILSWVSKEASKK